MIEGRFGENEQIYFDIDLFIGKNISNVIINLITTHIKLCEFYSLSF